MIQNENYNSFQFTFERFNFDNHGAFQQGRIVKNNFLPKLLASCHLKKKLTTELP